MKTRQIVLWSWSTAAGAGLLPAAAGACARREPESAAGAFMSSSGHPQGHRGNTHGHCPDLGQDSRNLALIKEICSEFSPRANLSTKNIHFAVDFFF